MLRVLIAIFALVSGFSLAGTGQGDNSGNVAATVVQPISLVKTQDAMFGMILSSGTARIINLQTTGDLVDGTSSPIAHNGPAQAAQFTLSASILSVIGTTVTVSQNTLSCNPGVIGTLVIQPGALANIGSPSTINVGASLVIPAGFEGAVNCNFEIVANYQ